MTDRAQQLSQTIKEVSWDWETMQPSHPHTIAVATLRKLNDIFDEEGYGGDEPCCCVFRDIVDIIEELEQLK